MDTVFTPASACRHCRAPRAWLDYALRGCCRVAAQFATRAELFPWGDWALGPSSVLAVARPSAAAQEG
eukprot:3304111-Alexandrium_andersonii.AAC.1